MKNNNYHRVCNYSNTTGAASRAGTYYPLGATQFSTVISRVRVARFLGFSVVFCWSVFDTFLLVIALSILRFTASYYSIGIFKLFVIYKLNAKTRMKFKCIDLCTNWNICNVIKIRSLICSLSLICHRVAEFSKPNHGPHEHMTLIFNDKNTKIKNSKQLKFKIKLFFIVS